MTQATPPSFVVYMAVVTDAKEAQPFVIFKGASRTPWDSRRRGDDRT
jgi:hypothetical protein